MLVTTGTPLWHGRIEPLPPSPMSQRPPQGGATGPFLRAARVYRDLTELGGAGDYTRQCPTFKTDLVLRGQTILLEKAIQGMDTVILETDILGPASQLKYDDSLTSYQFPSRYLKHFQPLMRNEDMLAIIYEPRGKPPRGRMAYVGWTVLRGRPRREPPGTGNAFRV